MDTSALPRTISADLPGWVVEELDGVGPALATDADRMRLVHALAARNPGEGGGGPFAALVVATETGEVVSAGVNLVLSSGLSGAHAEFVALSLAQARLGTWDLGAQGMPRHELVVNWRPCTMCLGSVLWSGVRRLVIAGEGPELEELTGFDEGPVREDWAEQLAARGIATTSDVLRAEALEVFAAYGGAARRSGAPVYNARAGRPS